jgi:hypothetical protein
MYGYINDACGYDTKGNGTPSLVYAYTHYTIYYRINVVCSYQVDAALK